MATFTIEISVDAGVEYFRKNPMLISEEIREKAAQIQSLNEWVNSLGPKDLAQLNACMDNHTVETPVITTVKESSAEKVVEETSGAKEIPSKPVVEETDWKTVAARKPVASRKPPAKKNHTDWADEVDEVIGDAKYEAPEEIKSTKEPNERKYNNEISDYKANIIEGELTKLCEKFNKNPKHYLSALNNENTMPNQQMCNWAGYCRNGEYCTYAHSDEEQEAFQKAKFKVFKYKAWCEKYYGY